MADPLDGTVTDNQHKKWNPDEPIHRINSPSFNSGQFTRANGDGVGRGCRLPVGAQLSGSLRRVLPAWVPVQDDAFKEIEGILVRSFQTWTDFPLTQWHSWYDWNFHVIPSNPYQYVRGEGNEEVTGRGTPVVGGAAMECEWDTGAFGNRFGAMFDRDWAWPMASQFVWIAGRWIYDCGHANSRNKMRSELHPCCAVATSRWEAQKFDSSAQVLFPVTGPLGIDTPFMPGVQFMFFASRLGGYVTVPGVFERDYEFIVDLPEETVGRTIIPIGATPDHPRNTVTLGPLRIVAKIDFTPFSNAKGTVNNSIQPILTVIPRADGNFPRQVKVKIPLSGVKGSADAYGVMISIGLVDQFLDLAKRVLLVDGSFDTATFLHRSVDNVAIKFGINGRWHRKAFNNVTPGQTRPLQEKFSFALALDHPPKGGGQILLSSHGKVIKGSGVVMEELEPNRILRVKNQPGGRVFQYEFDIVNPQKDPGKVDELEIAIADRLKGTFRVENEPLGVADFARRATQLGVDQTVFTLSGRELVEDNALAEIFFKVRPETTTASAARSGAAASRFPKAGGGDMSK
ncbi:MAG: hypothetical protein WKF84_30820 [Pyrinomonadaceae bacterium]